MEITSLPLGKQPNAASAGRDNVNRVLERLVKVINKKVKASLQNDISVRFAFRSYEYLSPLNEDWFGGNDF